MGIFEKNAARDLGWEYISLSTGNDDEGIFYCEKDNAIGSACMFAPLAGWDDKTPGAAATLLNEAYPGGTIMQFVQFASPYLEPVLGAYLAPRDGISGDSAVQTARHGTVSAGGRSFWLWAHGTS